MDVVSRATVSTVIWKRNRDDRGFHRFIYAFLEYGQRKFRQIPAKDILS